MIGNEINALRSKNRPFDDPCRDNKDSELDSFFVCVCVCCVCVSFLLSVFFFFVSLFVAFDDPDDDDDTKMDGPQKK